MSRKAWPRWALFAPLILVGLASARWSAELMPACIFHRETGLFCPGCGATRAAMALADGRWIEALNFNGLFVIAVVVGVVWVSLSAARERFPEVKWLGPFQWRLWFLWVTLGSLVIFGVLRNLPRMGWMGPG